jgi:glycosyltransferase involved in cell wall biosynthesis
MKKLKIAQVVNIWESVPPTGYGGTERVVYNLCQGLIKKGHHVDLFASGNSKTSSRLFYIFDEHLLNKGINWSNYLYSLLHFTYAYNQIKKSGGYNIIHGHYSLASDLISLAFTHLQDCSTVFTLHCPLTIGQKYEDRKKIFEYCRNVHYVSISNNQRTIPLSYIATIYHGINLSLFPFKDSSHGSLVWVGRITPEKGVNLAIDLANRLNRKMVIAGRVDKENEKNLNYFQTKIKNKLNNPLLTHLGEIDSNKRNELFVQAKCFLFPIQWEEPFGLVMIEAMACGTPIVAFARGSVPEVIKDGETGYIVNSSEEDKRGNWIVKKTGLEGLCQAVEKIYSMPEEQYKQMRRNCRSHVEKNFAVERMVDNYEKVYYDICSQSKTF